MGEMENNSVKEDALETEAVKTEDKKDRISRIVISVEVFILVLLAMCIVAMNMRNSDTAAGIDEAVAVSENMNAFLTGSE